MQKYKYIICIIFIVLTGITAVFFMRRKEESGMDVFPNAERAEKARIPKLEEGVNVHELENDIFEVLGPESVAISTDRSSGSGILWKCDGKKVMIVTTKHLMQDFEHGELELWTAEKLEFSKTDVHVSEELDLAVIITSSDKKLKLSKTGAENFSVENTLEMGEVLWIIDSVYGAASGISNCSVASSLFFLEDYGTEMILLYGDGKTGMSGSPIYDEDGKLVAMMSGMSENGTTLAAVPADKIMKFIETLEE